MRTQTPAWRIGLVLAIFFLLTWFPRETPGCGSWWGPGPCLGGEMDEAEANPENLVAGLSVGHGFTGQINILNNTMTDANGFYSAQLLNSFQGFTGIAQVNQAAGSLSSQVTYIGIAGSQGGAQATELGMNFASRVKNNSLTMTSNTYQAHIKGTSFASGAGIALVNQSAGHMNAQFNAFSLTIGSHAAENLSDIQLHAISSNNKPISDPLAPNIRSTRLGLDKGAFQDFTGIWSTSQIAGNMDQVTTIFNLSITPVP